MNTKNLLEEDILVKKAIEILHQQLGPVETIRFLNLKNEGNKTDSVKRHSDWQKTLNKDEFLNEIFGKNTSKDGKK